MIAWQRVRLCGIAAAAVALLGAGASFTEEPVVVARGGVTSLSLTARTDASGRDYYEYAGRAAAPTIHVVPGGRLNIDLSNKLNPLSVKPCVMSPCMQQTNLHFHGLEVSPKAPADDVLGMISSPGQRLSYAISIPKNHPAGLFWYHPHPHGESDRQVEDGMSGAIIVDGIVRYAPQVRGLRQRVLVVRDNGAPPLGAAPKKMAMSAPGMRFAAFIAQTAATPAPAPPASMPTPVAHCMGPEKIDDVLTINGTVQPTIDIAPGERQFWRIVNASADVSIDVDTGTPFDIIALDGVPLAVRNARQTSRRVEHLIVPPAGRLEAIVTGPPAGAQRVLRSRCIDLGPDGDPNPAFLLAQLGSAHAAAGSTVDQEVRTTTALAREPAGVGAAQARKAAQVITFTEDHYGFYINGRPFDSLDGPVVDARVGGLEHWHIVNKTHEVHPFHIHQVHFLPYAINGTIDPAAAWVDTVNVPPQASIDLVMDFTNQEIRGLAVFHCHILRHEDKGMMAKIRFY